MVGGDHRNRFGKNGKIGKISVHWNPGSEQGFCPEIINAGLYSSFLFDIEVCPDEEGNLIAVRLLFLRQSGTAFPILFQDRLDYRICGLMIAKENDNGILLLLFKIGNEFTKRRIAQAKKRKIVVQRLGAAFHFNLRIEVIKAFRIGGMVLHGYVEQKQRVVALIFIDFNDLFKIGLVAYIIADLSCIVKIREEIHFRKSHCGIDRIPVPAGGIVGMHGDRLIAQTRQVRGQRRRLSLDILLIGNAALRQKGHGISRQIFEFGVGRISAENGNVQPAGNGVFSAIKQAVDEGHIILIHRKITQNRRIGKRFVHDDNDVRELSLIRTGSCHGRFAHGFLLQSGEFLCRRIRVIARRLIHGQIPQLHDEGQGRSVLIADGGGSEKLVVQAQFLLHNFIGMEHQSERAQHDDECGRHGKPQLPGTLFQGETAEKFQDQKKKEAKHHKKRLTVQGIIIIARHAGRRSNGKQVPGLDRDGTEIQNKIIGESVYGKEQGFRHQSHMELSKDGKQKQSQKLKHDQVQNLRRCLHGLKRVVGVPLQQVKCGSRGDKQHDQAETALPDLLYHFFHNNFQIPPQNPLSNASLGQNMP